MAHGAIPATDPFSWTANGEPWTMNSWGFNVLLAAAHRLAGLEGVALASTALVAIVLALGLLLSRRLGGHPVVSGALMLAAFPLLILFFSARPQLIDYAAVLLLVLLLRELVYGERSVWVLLAIAALIVVWVNLHAAAPFGIAVITATTALVALNRDTRSRVGWCLAALAIATTCLVLNPYGWGVITHAIHVSDTSKGLITEWQRLDPTDPLQITMFTVGLLGLAIAVRRRDAVFVAAIAVAAAGSIQAMRVLPILVLVALPMIASSASRPGVIRYVKSRRVMLTRVASAGFVVMVVLAGMALAHLGRPDPGIYPSATVMKAIPKHCQLFNSYTTGGFIILQRPDVLVSIDSRNDLYGARRVATAARTLAGKGRVGMELANAGCVLVPPDSGLASRLGRSQGWELIETGHTASLYVRR